VESATEKADKKHKAEQEAAKKQHHDAVATEDEEEVLQYRRRKLGVNDIGRHPLDHITLEPGEDVSKFWMNKDQKQSWDKSLKELWGIKKVNDEVAERNQKTPSRQDEKALEREEKQEREREREGNQQVVLGKEVASQRLKPMPLFLKRRMEKHQKALADLTEQSWRRTKRTAEGGADSLSANGEAAGAGGGGGRVSPQRSDCRMMSKKGLVKRQQVEDNRLKVQERNRKERNALEEEYVTFREENSKAKIHKRAKEAIDERAREERERKDAITQIAETRKKGKAAEVSGRKVLAWDEKLLGLHGKKYEKKKKKADKEMAAKRAHNQKQQLKSPFEGSWGPDAGGTPANRLPRSQANKALQNSRQLCEQCGTVWSRRVTKCESCGFGLTRCSKDASEFGRAGEMGKKVSKKKLAARKRAAKQRG
jgi:hypothetical protein